MNRTRRGMVTGCAAALVALLAPGLRADPGDPAPAEEPPAASEPSPNGTLAPDQSARAADAVEALRKRGPRGGEGPLGFTGNPIQTGRGRDFVVIPDRWRIDFPRWQRYPESSGEGPYVEGGLADPYHQNVLKGDYPIAHIPHVPVPLPHIGGDLFINALLQSDTIAEARSFPLASGISPERSKSFDFRGRDHQTFVIQNATASVELFQGDTAFKPKDWAIKATAVANLNYLNLAERGVVDRDVSDLQDNRLDGHVGMQELFAEAHLADLSEYYDVLTLTAGIQSFTSDFRGFLYLDQNLGLRLNGTLWDNRIQFNLAWFRQLEKDTNSLLNTFETRDQDVFIANVYWQDLFALGYTAQASWHLNVDRDEVRFDDNGFLARPAPIGSVASATGDVRTKALAVQYLGWAGEGHWGPINISHQYYFAFGRDERNELSGRSQQVRAHMGAVEASYDLDWLRVTLSGMFASGDRDPRNGTAAGFDGIFDNPFFAGSGFSYWNRQNVPLLQTQVQLVNRLSLYPDLTTSKHQGQSNFVNPGLMLLGGGLSGRITPKLFADLNVNYLWFAETEALELIQTQQGIRREIGLDASLGVQYRPLLIDNVILTAGVGVLWPDEGFRAIYGAQTQYSSFLSLTLTY